MNQKFLRTRSDLQGWNLSMKMKVIILLLFASWGWAESETPVSAVMHGKKTAVEYRALNGSHSLVVKKRIEMRGNHAEFKQEQVVDLKLNEDEFVSSRYNFYCFTKDKIRSYGVISKKSAKQRTGVMPKMAWRVDDISSKLIPVDPKSVSCSWVRGGDEEFPFQ